MDGIELMATAMHAMRTRLDVAASNLANLSSDGFRRSVAHIGLRRNGLTTWATLDTKQGPLRHTGRAFDLAVAGAGGFLVRDASGAEMIARSGSFVRDARGRLTDATGRALLGEHGPLSAAADATIDDRGFVREAGEKVGRVRMTPDTALQSGFLEASNVDAVHEMVDVLAAQRAFETAQKALSAIDDVRAKATNELARVRS
jgi:flagellar basal-body rod protein FlgF